MCKWPVPRLLSWGSVWEDGGAPAGAPMTDDKCRSLSISTHTSHLPLRSPLLHLHHLLTSHSAPVLSLHPPLPASSSFVCLKCSTRTPPSLLPPSVRSLSLFLRPPLCECSHGVFSVLSRNPETHTHTYTHLETENTTRHYLAEKVLPACLPPSICSHSSHELDAFFLPLPPSCDSSTSCWLPQRSEVTPRGGEDVLTGI